jgi:hypothetical protein
MPEQIVPTATEGDLRFAVDPKDDVSVAEAMERFNDLVKNQRRVPVARAADGSHSLLREFDPNVDTIFRPQLRGG